MCGTDEIQRPHPPPEFRYKVVHTTTGQFPQLPDDSLFVNEWIIFGESGMISVEHENMHECHEQHLYTLQVLCLIFVSYRYCFDT